MVGWGGEVEVERDGIECEETEHDFQRLVVHVQMRFSALSLCFSLPLNLSLSSLSLSLNLFLSLVSGFALFAVG